MPIDPFEPSPIQRRSRRSLPGFAAAGLIAFIASACGGAEDPPGAVEGGRAPGALEASRDREDRVSISWSLPGGPKAEALVVERDGVEIARLSGDANSFDDSSAEPGAWEAPTGLRAEPRVDAIALTWTASARRDGAEHTYRIVADHGSRGTAASEAAQGRRAAPAGGTYRVARDGAAVMEVGDVSWLDAGATPGSLTGADVSAEGDAGAVHLHWGKASAGPGPTHSYVVLPITSVGQGPASEAVSASRLPARVEEWEIRRDGDPIASLPGTATSFDDPGAAPGFADPPEVRVESRQDGVELSWPEPPTNPGTTHRYELFAMGVSAGSAEAGRTSPLLVGIRIEIDDSDPVDLSASEGTYFDGAGEPGTLGAPSGLVALRGASGAVRLEWQAPSSLPGSPRVYRVVARTSDGVDSPSASIAAGRAAPDVDGYEVQRDGGPWIAVGSETSFDDGEGPSATMTATASLIADRALGFVELRLDGAPVVGAPPAVVYRVRARAGTDAGPASGPVTGVRSAGGAVRVQWQRSAADADADYADIPDAVFRSSVDLDASTTEYRYYRAILRADGAEGVSAPVRGKARGYASIAMGWGTTCGLQSDGLATCWGNLASLIPASEAFSKLSVGGGHACGLRASDGKMICWGDNRDGQAPPGPSAEPYLDMVAGYDHTCYLDETGGLWCIGGRGKGPLWSPGPYVSIAAEVDKTCAILATGGIDCWNQSGSTPAGSFTSVAIGYQFACGLRDDGKRLCWGYNYNGGAPPGPSDETFSVIASGRNHSCGLLDTGALRCFGRPVGRPPPDGPTAETWVDLAVKENLTFALGADGKVRSWGEDYSGNAPFLPVTGAFSSLSTTYGFTCGLRASDGRRVCWGWDSWSDSEAGPSAEPFLAVATGVRHGCGILQDHSVVCWGDDTEGQAPPGSSADRFDAITAGYDFTCGIRVDGKVVCWGRNDYGQAPPAPSADSFASISAGDYHTCGVRVDGKVLCWGPNDWGKAPPGPSADTFLSLVAGEQHTCGIRSDSKLVCWGRNYWGEAPTTPPSDTFRSVAVGYMHTCGIRTDGTAKCYGWNLYGQRDAPPTEVFRELTAKGDHTCGLNDEGKVICWGTNYYGQAPPPGASP